MRASVEAAESRNTYVTVHVYTPYAIQAAIRVGIKCIDHGQLMDEETAGTMADKDIWLSIQPFLNNEFSIRETAPDRIEPRRVCRRHCVMSHTDISMLSAAAA